MDFNPLDCQDVSDDLNAEQETLSIEETVTDSTDAE